jgi:phage regulator Rha-like protein
MSDTPETSLVFLVSERPVASSLDVAAHFGKNHRHVLRAIQKHLEDMREVFNQPNFGLVDESKIGLARDGSGFFFLGSYLDAKGEQRPMYNLTRDGFSLLAMGFTGKAALIWKMRYIEAFNAMEAHLLDKEKSLLNYRANKIFLAGKLQAMMDRERDNRKELIKKVLTCAEVRYSHRKIARMLDVSRYAVDRILRRYSPYAEDYFALDMIGRENDTVRRNALIERGRQMTREAADRRARHAALPR